MSVQIEDHLLLAEIQEEADNVPWTRHKHSGSQCWPAITPVINHTSNVILKILKCMDFMLKLMEIRKGEVKKVFLLIYTSDKNVWKCKCRHLCPGQTFLPARMRVRFTASVVPDELPAAIICARVLVIPDPIALLSHTNQTRLSGNAETVRPKQVDDRRRGGLRGWGTCCPWWPIQFASPLM